MSRDPLPKDTSTTLGLIAFALVALLWIAWFVWGAEFLGFKEAFKTATGGPTSDGMAARGQFGDMFGVLNVLFSAAAFAALFWTALMQRHQGAIQQREIRDHWDEQDAEAKRVLNGHWETIGIDLLVVGQLASAYVGEWDKVKMPSYRLPLFGREKALPALLATGLLDGKDASALVHFYVVSDNFNRGLDEAQRVVAISNEQWGQEVTRAKMKAYQLRPWANQGEGRSGQPSMYDKVHDVLSAHGGPGMINRLSLQFGGGVLAEVA
jgi:hypothetical protein